MNAHNGQQNPNLRRKKRERETAGGRRKDRNKDRAQETTGELNVKCDAKCCVKLAARRKANVGYLATCGV